MTNLPQPPRTSYKAFLWDYDDLLSRSDDECCYSLSEREIQILLAQVDPIAWRTRYKPTNTEIDVNLLLKWQGNLARKLMSGCCPDEGKIYRFTEDGELEVSTDGGETWEPAPEDDPRLTATRFPPLPGTPGSAYKCTAANNAVGNLKQMADQLIDDAGLWGGLTFLIAAIQAILVFIGIFASGGLLTPLIVGLAGSLLTFGQVAFEAAMTDEVYETLCCIFYCNMNNDGTFTQEQIDTIKSEISSQLTGVAATYLRDNVGLLGAIGMSNMAATNQSAFTFDCSGCDCVPYCESADSWFAATVNSITDNGDGTITFNVSSVDNGGGVQYVAWGDRVDPDSPCCEFLSFVPTTGFGVPGGAVQLCGSGVETGIIPTGGNCYHYWHMYQDSALSTPFTANVTFTAC